MATERKSENEKSSSSSHDSSSTSSCKINSCFDNECLYTKTDSYPYGIKIIPGSGKLNELPEDCKQSICLEEISTDICPKALPPQAICVKDCCEFEAVKHINFINGDLIIGRLEDGKSDLCNPCKGYGTDALNIFPNLLGVNGSIYIVDTDYRKITGFEKLRFVTGSIVIANNPNLILLPTFPSLLNVSQKVLDQYYLPRGEKVPARCERGAIIIANNGALRRIVGFEVLRQVSDGIIISQNACLTDICGFVHLYRTDRVVIYKNLRLNKLVGFYYTDTLNVGLFLLNNNLEGEYDINLNAFKNLHSAKKIIVIANSHLRSLKLENLKLVCKDFVVRFNEDLEELISSVEYVGNLSIENNKSLKLIKFPLLREVNHTLEINSNCSLVCLDTFDKLFSVGSAITIADNAVLAELKGFNELKYIGSKCVFNPGSTAKDVKCGGCGCTANLDLDWKEIIKTLCDPCIAVDEFDIKHYDKSDNACEYILPEAFFKLVCSPAAPCNEVYVDHDKVAQVVDFSLIIFRNSRLRAIGGFGCLKHVESNIYIVANTILHTVNAFGKLVFALDVWIRNNPHLKHIIGFGNLLSIRDLVALESVCLSNWDNIKCLEYAQRIAIESKTANSVKLPKHPIPSVYGYILYYTFDRA